MHPVAHADSSAQLNMELTLGLRNRAALDQLLRDQQNPSSTRYHRWLTAEQFNAQFGPSPQDAGAVAQWLTAQGFQVTATNLDERYVRFTGSVSDAERAFRTDIMAFGDGTSYSNTTDPLIPARIAGIVSAIRGLNNFLHWQAANAGDVAAPDAVAPPSPLVLLNQALAPQPPSPAFVASRPEAIIGPYRSFAPTDFYSFYNEGALLAGGTNGGGGDCIAIVGDSAYLLSAPTTFNSTFGLLPSSVTGVFVDGTYYSINNDETEALLDVEWSHAVAPGASTRFYLANPLAKTPNSPLVDAISKAVTDNVCGAISVSFGLCGGDATFYTGTLHGIYLRAAAQGQSIFISSGDQGAAGIVVNSTNTACVTGTSLNVNELGADPNVTQIGGTGFNPDYDGAGHNVGNVSESAWNDEGCCRGGATGGGASAYYSKPSYQSGSGVPADGRRDVPDVGLIASPNFPGGFMAYDQSCGPKLNTCTGAGPVGFIPIGGTSLSAPAWAGISKLIAQLKKRRPGPLNPTIYGLANSNPAAAGFRDVTSGDNSFNGVAGFSAGPGFDLTTGWGTVDIGTFAKAYVHGVPPTPTPTRTPTPTPRPTPSLPPVITSIPSVIVAEAPNTILGEHFTPRAVVNVFVSTASGPVNVGPVWPSFTSPSKIVMGVPATTLGEGFAALQVVDTDAGYLTSNIASALLQGNPLYGIPTLTAVNGVGLAATSSDPRYAVNNVEAVIAQGTTVTLSGIGFDATDGVAVNVFCACTGGLVGPIYINPGPGLTSNSLTFNLPATVLTGPGSLVVINKGFDGNYTFSSNAVSVPIGQALSVSLVTQSGDTITVNGTGFSTLTIINFFNRQGSATVNLGGLGTGGAPRIPLTVVNSTTLTFSRPISAVAGAAYVQAVNPPFVPYTSSGTGAGGAFTLE